MSWILASAAARSAPLFVAAVVEAAGEYPMERVSSGLYGRPHSTWGLPLWLEDRSSSSVMVGLVDAAASAYAAVSAAAVSAAAAFAAAALASAASATVSPVVFLKALQVQATTMACPCRCP